MAKDRLTRPRWQPGWLRAPLLWGTPLLAPTQPRPRARHTGWHLPPLAGAVHGSPPCLPGEANLRHQDREREAGGSVGCCQVPGSPCPRHSSPLRLRGVFPSNGLASGKEKREWGTIPWRACGLHAIGRRREGAPWRQEGSTLLWKCPGAPRHVPHPITQLVRGSCCD